MGPAPVDAGFIFVRVNPDGSEREVRATAKAVTATAFATVLGDRDGPIVSTAEHVLAALRGMGVDNATIEVDGPEVPIMDGSAAAFVAAIDQAGIVEQSAPRRFIQVLKPIQVKMGESVAELRPYADGFRADIEIDFANPVIGRQNFSLDLNPASFRREVSRARTFGCVSDVAKLWEAGFALGASFENSVVFDETHLLNAEGLRYADECARHKVLDVIGDLALAGLPLLACWLTVAHGDWSKQSVRVVPVSRMPWAAWSAAWLPRPMVRMCPDPEIFRLKSFSVRLSLTGSMVRGAPDPTF
jgi:UDP-3-O-[3-hydroxymyristoyl] N-acetylglucosamine deacetylase